jgi:hypothetical protein
MCSSYKLLSNSIGLACVWMACLCCSTGAALADCATRSFVVSLEAEFSFSDRPLNNVEILNSLGPNIFVGDEYADFDVTNNTSNGVLVSKICIYEELKAGQTLFFHYGLQHLNAIVRPISWTVTKDAAGNVLKRGTQPTLSFQSQKAPDWVIPVKAELKLSESGKKMVYVEFLNASSTNIPGFDIIFDADDADFFCASLPHVEEIHVSLRTNKEQAGKDSSLSAFVKDAAFGDLVSTSAKMMRGPCGEHAISIDLGSSGDFKANERSVIRYIFDDNFVDNPGILGMRKLKLMEFSFKGGIVYPSELSITPSG